MMLQELQKTLNIPIQLVLIEELGQVLEQTRSSTVVTSAVTHRVGKPKRLPHPNQRG
jgi:hypothetical protein